MGRGGRCRRCRHYRTGRAADARGTGQQAPGSRSEEQSNGEPRFGLLDTLHAFGRARLDARADAENVRRLHAEYFAALAETAERALVGPDQRIWLDRLEGELGNLRTALRWAIDRRDTSLALKLASALWFFWDMRGHLMEGQQWLATAMAMPGDGLEQLRASALNAAGWLALVQHGAYARGITLLQEGRSAAMTAGDERALVRADAFLGLALALGTREYAQSDELLQAAVSGGRTYGDPWAVALALYGLGHMAAVQGQWPLVSERWRTAATVAQGVGNLYGQSYLQFRWGVLALRELDLPRAAACLRASLQMASELDSTREMAVAMAALALVAWAGGQARRAARLAGATQAFLERAGCYLPAFLNSEYELALASVRERLRPGAFTRSFAAGHGLTPRAAVAEALETGELPHHLPLSAREWQVARLVARGLSNKEVGDHLGLSERTIGTHLERIFGKLQIKSRAELAVWAVEREAPEGLAASAPGVTADEGGNAAQGSSRGLRLVGS